MERVVKKLFYRLLLTVVVVACVMPFFMHGRYGQPLMTVVDLKMPKLEMPDWSLSDSGQPVKEGDSNHAAAMPAGSGDSVTVYRWQDDRGIWHFSDDVNPEGGSEAVNVSFNAGVSESGAEPPTPMPASSQTLAEVDVLSSTLPLLHAGETLNQARNVEKILQQRYQHQEQILAH